MSKQIDATTSTIHLQGIGRCSAKRADELAVGDVTGWNYGESCPVKSVTRVSPAFVSAVLVDNKGVEHTRRMKIDRMVAVAA